MNIQAKGDAATARTTGGTLGYMSGSGNSFEIESLPGALPVGRNSPQKPAYGL